MQKPVLFRVTNNLDVGGVQRRLAAVLPLLARTFEVHVVTYRGRGVFFDALREQGVQTHFLPMRGKWSPAGIARLAAMFRSHGALVVHTHSLGANIPGMIAARLAGVPVRVAQVHVAGNHWYARTALGRRKQAVQEALVHRLCTDRVLHVAEQSLEGFVRGTGLPRRMNAVLHNGVDFAAMLDQPVSNGSAPSSGPAPSINPAGDVRAEFGIAPDEVLVGFVGRLATGKGVDFALDFMRRLHAVNPRARMLLVGGGASDAGLARLRAEAAAIGDGRVVLLAGQRLDVQACYRAFDALLFPSEELAEGMPGVVLEACAFGLPVIARHTQPVREIARYYDRIRFMDDDADPATVLADALALPPSDGARFRDEFDIHAMARRSLDLYRAVLVEKGLDAPF
ncbi:MAG TPA: glycosyltransferase [Nitratidesulfovibrio sp.]|nr:glycosyltransferase [Nitratidesulfovibrio sp.]